MIWTSKLAVFETKPAFGAHINKRVCKTFVAGKVIEIGSVMLYATFLINNICHIKFFHFITFAESNFSCSQTKPKKSCGWSGLFFLRIMMAQTIITRNCKITLTKMEDLPTTVPRVKICTITNRTIFHNTSFL